MPFSRVQYKVRSIVARERRSFQKIRAVFREKLLAHIRGSYRGSPGLITSHRGSGAWLDSGDVSGT